MAPRLHISFTTIFSPWHRAAEAAAGARWRSDVDRNVAGSPDQSKPSESARDSKSASTRDPSNGSGMVGDTCCFLGTPLMELGHSFHHVSKCRKVKSLEQLRTMSDGD